MRIPWLFRRKKQKITQYIPVGLNYVNDLINSSTADEPDTLAGKCMNVPVFAEAVEYISDMMASMPVKLYHRVGNKIVEKPDDTRIILLNIDTKSGMSGYQLKKRIIKDYLLYGSGYAAIRKYKGKINGLFYVSNLNVSISNTEEIRLYYRPYKIRIGVAEYEPYEFLKVLRDSTDGVSGRGLVNEFRSLINTQYQSLVYTRTDAATGGVCKMLLKILRSLAPDQAEEQVNDMRQEMRIVCKSDQEPFGIGLGDIEVVKLDDGYVKQDLTERIKLFEKGLRNLFHLKDDFYETFREAIFPVIKAFEAALNMDLLTTDEQSNYFFEVDTSEVLKANIKERYAAHKTAIEAGIKTINEVRKDENLEEIEGLDWTKVDLGTAVYKGNQIHVVNTGETISLTSKSPVEGGEKNVKSEMR